MSTPEKSHFDTIVVGAGVMGLWTANHLIQKGQNVLLLEQFQFPHKRGSSGDGTRLCRFLYQDPIYADMALESLEYWKNLEKECGQVLLVPTGALWICKQANRSYNEKLSELMTFLNRSHDMLGYTDLRKRFPMFTFESDCLGLFEKYSCVMMVVRCNSALLSRFKEGGGVFHDLEKLIAIKPGNLINITTSCGEYTADNLVLTPGPWLGDVLEMVDLHVPTKTLPGTPCFFKERILGAFSFASGTPVLMEQVPLAHGYQFFYTFPSIEYPGLVKCATRGQPAIEEAHPDDRDKGQKNEIIAQLKRFVRRRMLGIEDEPSIIEGCMYTMTSDRHYIIDRHPNFSNIVIGGGGSGNAYKNGPVLGKLLSQLVLNDSASYNLETFKVTRFAPKAKI